MIDDRKLKAEYEDFIKTDKGEKWLSDVKNRIIPNDKPDLFGLFLYDFYPEYLA
jgi:hypothetical protein